MENLVVEYRGVLRPVTAEQLFILVRRGFISPDASVLADGESVPVEKVDGGLIAVPVGEGEHEIVVRYYPAMLNAGIAVSLLTAAGLVILRILINVRRRNTNVLA